MLTRMPFARFVLAFVMGGLCLLLTPRTPAAEDIAPAPHASPIETDRAIIAEIKSHSELMKNLQYLSDEIGGRLTGSANVEKANRWTAEKMKQYGLENVRLEPWEIPFGWERGKAEMKLVEPNTGRTLLIASRGWTPGTKGKVTGDVVLLKARTRADLQTYKGKLKNAVVLLSRPANVAPVTDLRYGPPPVPGKRNRQTEEPKKDTPKKETPKKDTPEDIGAGSWICAECSPASDSSAR